MCMNTLRLNYQNNMHIVFYLIRGLISSQNMWAVPMSPPDASNWNTCVDQYKDRNLPPS